MRLFLVAAVLALTIPADARLTGTNPTGASSDAWCVGKKSAESCVDYLGDILPTTNGRESSGTSSLQWSDVETAALNSGGGALAVTGSMRKVIPTAVTVAAGTVIDPTVGCGGIVILTTTQGSVTANAQTTFVTASSANKGCIVTLVNLGMGTITLDTVANFPAISYPNIGQTGAVVLNTDNVLQIGSIGTAWLQIGTVAPNH